MMMAFLTLWSTSSSWAARNIRTWAHSTSWQVYLNEGGGVEGVGEDEEEEEGARNTRTWAHSTSWQVFLNEGGGGGSGGGGSEG